MVLILLLLFAVFAFLVSIGFIHLLIAYIWWHLHPKSCLWIHVIWIIVSLLFGAPLGYHLLAEGGQQHRQPRSCMQNCGSKKIYWVDMSMYFLGRRTFLPLVEFQTDEEAHAYAKTIRVWPWQTIQYEIKHGYLCE